MPSHPTATLAQATESKPKVEAQLLDRVLDVLTPNQSRMMQHLWEKKTARYETLRTIPGAWRDIPSDEAITAALKKMRTRLDENNLSMVEIRISQAKLRVNIVRPAD